MIMKMEKRAKWKGFLPTVTLVMVWILTFTGMCPDSLFAGTQKFTLAALGDCIIAKKISTCQEPRFLELVKLIRNADCTWANSELPVAEDNRGYAQFREMDIPGICPPWVADELKWLGVDIVGLAHNHTMDYGYDGLFATIENFERTGIAYAGAGKDLEFAARPGYVNTHAGTVGLVNFASWFHYGTFASHPNPYVRGRPGLNPLHTEETIYLDTKSFDKLKASLKMVYDHFRGSSEKEKETRKKTGDAQVAKVNAPRDEKDADKPAETSKPRELEDSFILNVKVVENKEFKYDRVLNETDVKRITGAVKIAKRNARIVIAANHEHIGKNKQTGPAGFLERISRECIDAGADVVINTGPHRIWGIEIYKGKPIFYSLGNFFFQITTREFPAETYTTFDFPGDTRDGSVLVEKLHDGVFKDQAYWQGILPLVTFEKIVTDGKETNKVKEIRLVPFEYGLHRPLYEQGIPYLASPGEAREIIENLAKMSKPYQTVIEFRNGMGLIKL